jgi:hypothetical protein
MSLAVPTPGANVQALYIPHNARQRSRTGVPLHTQEASGVVVEDVPALFLRQELHRFNHLYRHSDGVGPPHLLPNMMRFPRPFENISRNQSSIADRLSDAPIQIVPTSIPVVRVTNASF